MKDQTSISRATLGALAGFAATAVMTAAMQRLHERLPERQRYPLTPREIVERVAAPIDDETLATSTFVAHFLYGAVTGAIYGLAASRPRLLTGAAFGLSVWCASYLGWIPALRILKPAHRHPAQRNALMIGAHALWGAATAWSLDEMLRCRRGAFAAGKLKDAP